MLVKNYWWQRYPEEKQIAKWQLQNSNYRTAILQLIVGYYKTVDKIYMERLLVG